MNNPITEYKRMFRVIGGELKELIGDEFELHTDYIQDNLVMLKTPTHRFTETTFKKSNVQELTPLSFDNRRIAIGDEVMWVDGWYLVYGYFWGENEWKVQIVGNNDWSNGCCDIYEEHVRDHRTPQNNKVDLSDDELLEEVRKRGLVESKEVVK